MKTRLLVLALAPLGALPLLGACPGDETDATATGTTTTSAGGGAGGLGGSAGAASGGGGSAAGGGGSAGAAGCSPAVPIDGSTPALLSQTGLYSDIAQKTLAPYVRPFQPQFELWSDGA